MKPKKSKSLTVIPLGNRILISRPPEKENPNKERKVGGIIIPQVGQTGKVMDPYFTATALAVGADCKRVKKGDIIIVARPDIFHVETEEPHRTESYMTREESIHAVIR